MNVKYLIHRAAKAYPENLGLVFQNKRLSFAELNTRANQLANALLNRGVNKGDRIGILMRNCCEYIETDFALSKAGIVRVPLNIRLLAEENISILNDSGASVIICGEEFIVTFQGIRSQL